MKFKTKLAGVCFIVLFLIVQACWNDKTSFASDVIQEKTVNSEQVKENLRVAAYDTLTAQVAQVARVEDCGSQSCTVISPDPISETDDPSDTSEFQLGRILGYIDQDIQTLIQDKSCLQDSDCQTIGFGAKPCGGPAKYIVYSTQTTPPDLLRFKITFYNELNAELVRIRRELSNCQIELPPQVKCEQNKCI